MVERYTHNTFFLIRHGEAETNIRNVVSSSEEKHVYHLTERGKRQIEETGVYLRSYSLDFIVTSPVTRARESAEILRALLGLPLSVDERLAEAGFGIFEDHDIDSFLGFMRSHGGRTAGDPERGIEGYMDIRERVQSFLNDVSGMFSEKRIVVVSHGDTLQEMYAELMNIPVGPSQRQGHSWFPKRGACMLVSHDKNEEYVPQG